MNKIKRVSKSGDSRLLVKSLKGQQVNGNEVYAINSQNPHGLLHIEVIQKRTSFKMIYNISGLITLQEYLKTPMNRERFAVLLQSILLTVKSMDKLYLNQQHLLMDFDKVMFSYVEERLYFAYVPIQFFETGVSLQKFLLDIIQFARFSAEEDTKYIRNYIEILNSGINFSLFELEEYVNEILVKKQNIPHEELSDCLSCKEKSENYGEPYEKGFPITNNKAKGIYDPLKECIKQKSIFNGSYLIRKRTGERILINNFMFSIGKGRSGNDYLISDNDAVSRKHASIITRQDKYYIVDMNSTNKTYVDDRMIPVGQEVEIFSGSKLRLANEEFIFYIE